MLHPLPTAPAHDNGWGEPVRSPMAKKFHVPSEGTRLLLGVRRTANLEVCTLCTLWASDWAVWVGSGRIPYASAREPSGPFPHALRGVLMRGCGHSTWTRARLGPWPWVNRQTVSTASGTSSYTSSTCRRPMRGAEVGGSSWRLPVLSHSFMVGSLTPRLWQ